MRRFTGFQLLPSFGAAVFLLLAGCGRDGVKVYHVDASDSVATTPPPVVATAPVAMPSSMPNGLPAPDNSGLPKLKYVLPEGWKEKAPSQLRVASFQILENDKMADISVIPLGGSAGGDVANVNRWRGQVGQPPLDEAQLKQSAESVQAADQPAELYDIAGTEPGSGDETRILGAILHTDAATWYFKMTGDSALVEKNKAAFVAFLKSVEFQSSNETPSSEAAQLPASHPAIPGLTPGMSAEPAGASKPQWTVPAGWQEGELAQFLVARYVIAGPGETSAAVNVSELDGTGGGLLPNLNRWRSQLAQPAITDDDAAKLPTFDASGSKAVVADFTGTDARTGKPARLIGVVLPLNGQTWFYKLMGDPNLVAQQKETLIQFVQSAQYPAAK